MRTYDIVSSRRLLPIVLTAMSAFQPALARGQTAAEEPAPALPLVPTVDATRPPSAASTTPALRYRMHSPGLVGGGAALLVAAAVSLGVSSYFFYRASQHAGGEGANDTNDIMAKIVGIPLLLHSIGCAVGGGAMIAIGNRAVLAEGTSARGMLEPRVGPSWGATLVWSF